MKAWIIYKFRQDSGMQVPGSVKIIEGHNDFDLAKNTRDEMLATMSPAEKRVGWSYSIQETEIHVKVDDGFNVQIQPAGTA